MSPNAPEAQDDNLADSSAPPTINGINGHSHATTTEIPEVNGSPYQHTNSDTPRLTLENDTNGVTQSPSFVSSKKRKFDELHSRSRSTSRAASPPWKPFAADGPTQFTEGGKRRSGRVNHIPLELQPPSDKRTTRAAHGSSVGSKSQKRGHSLKEVYTSSSPKVNGVKDEPHSSPPKRLSSVKLPSKHESRAGTTRQSQGEGHPTRISSRVKISPKHFDEVISPPRAPDASPPMKRRPGRPPKSSYTQQHRTPTSSPEARRVKRESFAEPMEDTHAPGRSPRLRLKLPRAVLYPRHPDYIPKPPKFSSLIEVLDTYDAKEKEQGPERDDSDVPDARQISKTQQSPDEIAEQEAKSRLRILDAAKPGGPLSRESCSLFWPDAQDQPPPQYSHTDHLWAHGAYFRTLLNRERARHMDMAKKTAYACLAKWKEKQPQTEEEREKEENEWFRLIYKQTVKDVQRKWELITGEIERRRLAQWIEEQELTRDRKMQKLLEDTTEMLNRRRTAFADSDESGAESADDISASDTEGSHGESASGSAESDDDDNMSSSESDSEDGEEVNLDENLSPEALRAKYANLPELAQDEDEGADSMDVDQSEIPHQDADTPADVEDMSHVQLEDVDDALLDDEADESTDMSDDMGSSDEDEGSADEGSGEEEEEEDDVGLMGFFGRKARQVLEEQPDMEGEQTAEVAGEEGAKTVKPDEMDIDVPEAAKEESKVEIEADPMLHDENLHPGTSVEGDHSSQPTPMDDSTAAPTEADSTTTLDPEEIAKIMPSSEETQPARKITTKIPSLLRATLREYQHYGVDWLAKLYANQTNGILADEMGLGKTIQTIALLAHLAEEHEVWGPHLIVVPTSVILNWEMEFKKFLPGFKVLSYYGTQEERQQKRKGWSNPDNYNVVITSYQLILKDLSSIRVPEWHYMILDEAHNIKNFQSQRYQAMIRLKTHARLLLTGTPLQNSIQELWSLLTFLTAGQDGQGMGDLDEFTQWFKRPVDEIFVDGKNKLGIEAQEIVNKLHHSLRPYILRRMKSQVEKQLPAKFEHTVFCRLSKRQRQLYDAFLSRADVKEKLSSGNPISVSQALMALRKVCNHPDLFEERPIVTSFTVRKPYSRMPRSVIADYEVKNLLVRRQLLTQDPDHDSGGVILRNFDLRRRERWSKYHAHRGKQLSAAKHLHRWFQHMSAQRSTHTSVVGTSLDDIFSYVNHKNMTARVERLDSYVSVTDKRAEFAPTFGCDLVERCTLRTTDRLPFLRPQIFEPIPDTAPLSFMQPLAAAERGSIQWRSTQRRITDRWLSFDAQSVLPNTVSTLERLGARFKEPIQKFAFVTPNAIAQDVLQHTFPEPVSSELMGLGQSIDDDPFHEARVRLSIAFPDKRLLQYDCGKLQRLAVLLRDLHDRGSRALIFTQMTSVLDILERFLNIHGYKYMRLDGSTRIEQRQDMMERFNRDERIDVFILSSRSGGIGMNLTGADSVIFYDLDWNPQMDKQCQDRAHRIGQTRDVHIYKLVSEHTIEVNILKKSNQKRMLDEVVIQEGEFTTDFFERTEDPADGYEANDAAGAAVDRVLGLDRKDDVGKVLAAAEEHIDVEAAKSQQKEAYVDDADFDFDKHRTKMPSSGVATPAVPADQSLLGEETEGNSDERPHVDEYMLRFVQKAYEHVRFVPPVDKKKGRLDQNGRDRSHRPKKIR